jgi:hypothetical protein
MAQIQTKIESRTDHDHSSIRLARNTIPPTPTASLLVQAEIARAHGDMVLTVQDQPEVIGMVAELMGVEPHRVRVHMAVINGTLTQAVFVDSRIRLGKAAKEVLNKINGLGFTFRTSSELILELESV